MKPEKDWIIENIKDIMKEKNLKLETISSQIGISQGEFSKILNGQREDYCKYLHLIAPILQVSYHELITPKHTVQYNNTNYGEIQTNGIGNASKVSYPGVVELYERLIKKAEEKAELYVKIIEDITKEKDSYFDQVEKLKQIINDLKQGENLNT